MSYLLLTEKLDVKEHKQIIDYIIYFHKRTYCKIRLEKFQALFSCVNQNAFGPMFHQIAGGLKKEVEK